MTSNPYESPQSDGPQREAGLVSPNVYRDGSFLVMNLHKKELAPVCVGSGLPSDDFLVLRRRLDSRNAFFVHTLIGDGLVSRALVSDPESVQVKLPVNQAWFDRARRQTRTNYLVVGIGSTAILASIVLVTVSEWLMLVGLIAFVFSIVFAFATQRSTMRLRLVKKKRDWVWISGAATEVIARHPDLRSNKKLEFLTYA